MKKNRMIRPLALAVSLLCAGMAHSAGQPARIQHVLMISVDGMHQQDLQRCVAQGTCPNIAALANHGVTYTNAFTLSLIHI